MAARPPKNWRAKKKRSITRLSVRTQFFENLIFKEAVRQSPQALAAKPLNARTFGTQRWQTDDLNYAAPQNHHRPDHHRHGYVDGDGVFVSVHIAGSAFAHRQRERNRGSAHPPTRLRRGK